MSTGMETVEEGNRSPNTHNKLSGETPERKINWLLLLLNCSCVAVGTIGGPLLLRLYYLHGGSRKWLSSWLQTSAFPIVLLPLSIIYQRDRTQAMAFLSEPKLVISSILIGLLVGLDNFLYSQGNAYLPVSTSSLLFSTQLAFTAFFALIIVRQKFTPYSINAVVLMTLGAILLGIRKSGDRPPGVTSSEYLLGFILTLGAALLLGFILPCIEFTYGRANKAITYMVVMQFQFNVTLFATIFCTIGMLINKDFTVIAREARLYDLGEAKYYIVLISTALVFQLLYIGNLGLIFCTSSLFAGVLTSTLLPLTEIAGVIFFHEKFTGEKGLALALCLWGFSSYFYGSYRSNKKQTTEIEFEHQEENGRN